ncbi:MAG: hypothetical protein LBU21_02320, partial [Treponema sp.]|nr:hypothetical protein [Treponema sp.]
ALKRTVLGQAPVLFQAYRPYKSTFYKVAFPKLRFWESLSTYSLIPFNEKSTKNPIKTQQKNRNEKYYRDYREAR